MAELQPNASSVNLFITGAAGFIGGSVAQRLVADGHVVRGLVRGPTQVDPLARRGIVAVVGNLDDADLLESEARRSDGVVNAASSDHRASVEAMMRGLAGSGKPLLHTSGSSVIGDDARGETLSQIIFDETTPLTVEPLKAARHAVDRLVLHAADDGVRSIVLCNSLIYGTGHGLHPDSVQIPPLVTQARRSGVVRVVGSGINRWSTVHIDDVVDLYVLALRSAPASAFYFVENGEASFAEIGNAIAKRLNLPPVQSWTVEQATREWGEGRARYSYGSNSRVRAVRARCELGWAPRHASVADWIETDMPIG